MTLLDRIKRLLTDSHEAPSKQSAGVPVAAEPSAASKASGAPERTADVDSKCPHCDHRLAQKPLRKKKCPNCGNYIYVRSTPSGQKKVLVTEQQAGEIDNQWQRYHKEKLLNSDPEYRRECDRVKARLTGERGTEPSEAEVRWALYSERILQHVRYGDWGLYRNTKVEMAQQLQDEGKLRQALRTYLEVCYLDANGPCNRGPKPFDPIQAITAPGITREVRELSRSLRLRPEQIRGMFIEAADVYHNNLPVGSAKAWDQLRLELEAAHKDNPDPS